MSMALAAILSLAIIAYMLFNNKNMRSYNQYMKRKKRLEESLSFFTADELYSNQNVVMGINNKEKKLAISTMKQGNPHPYVFNFDDLTACEIVEYEVDDRVSQAKGQSLGHVLGNSVGQVLGTEESDKISRIDLKISSADPEKPYVLANFLFWEVAKDSEEYKVVSEAVEKWHGIIEKVIRKQRAYFGEPTVVK